VSAPAARRVRVATAVITAYRQPGRLMRALGLSHSRGPAVSLETIRTLGSLAATLSGEVSDLRAQLTEVSGEIVRIQAELDQVTASREPVPEPPPADTSWLQVEPIKAKMCGARCRCIEGKPCSLPKGHSGPHDGHHHAAPR